MMGFEPQQGVYLREFELPKMTWQCKLISNVHWQVEEGRQPNAFHRFMQRLAFGLKWERLP